MKYFVAVCVLLTASAATPVPGAAREAVNEAIITKKSAIKSNILSNHGVSFIQAMDVLRMHRGNRSFRHDHDESSRQLRKDSKSNKSSKSKSAKNVGCICDNTDDLSDQTQKEELDQCKQDLEELKKPSPAYLFVQMADGCIFKQDEDGSISIHSDDFLEDTEQFSDKPFRYESTVPTNEFFDKFDSTYFPDPDDKPNAAITLMDEGVSEGVVVSVFASAFHETDEEGKTVYGYKLTQSEEQDAVKSLKDIMDGKDTNVYDHCSVFIDDASGCSNPDYVYEHIEECILGV